MSNKNIKKIIENLREQEEECPLCSLDESEVEKIMEDIGWSDLPDGWTEKSIKKFAKSLTGKDVDEEGFWTKCFERIKDEEGFDEESAKKFCSSLVDHIKGSTYWRGD